MTTRTQNRTTIAQALNARASAADHLRCARFWIDSAISGRRNGEPAYKTREWARIGRYHLDVARDANTRAPRLPA